MQFIGPDKEVRILIPIEFMRTVKKLWGIFGEGECTIDEKRITLSGEDDAVLTTNLGTSGATDFAAVVGRVWPGGKIDTKTLVDIPERLPDVLNRANIFAKGKEGDVTLNVVDNKLTITSKGTTGTFEESMKFAHPNVKIKIASHHLTSILPYVDRMYIGQTAIVVFGPKRFCRALTCKS
jgi:hypothetical protein